MTKGRLSVEIWNGPEQVVGGYGLSTEQAVEEVCCYLPVVDLIEMKRLKDEKDEAQLQEMIANAQEMIAKADLTRLRIAIETFLNEMDALENPRQAKSLFRLKAVLKEVQ